MLILANNPSSLDRKHLYRSILPHDSRPDAPYRFEPMEPYVIPSAKDDCMKVRGVGRLDL